MGCNKHEGTVCQKMEGQAVEGLLLPLQLKFWERGKSGQEMLEASVYQSIGVLFVY